MALLFDRCFILLIQICDAVAVAWLLNATLIIPIFHLNSVWRDSRLYNHHFLFIIHILTEFRFEINFDYHSLCIEGKIFQSCYFIIVTNLA